MGLDGTDTSVAVRQMTAALGLVGELARRFPELPGLNVMVSELRPDRVRLTLHDGLSGFEAWREGLGIAPDAVSVDTQVTGEPLWRLEALGTFAGVSVELVAYSSIAQAEVAR